MISRKRHSLLRLAAALTGAIMLALSTLPVQAQSLPHAEGGAGGLGVFAGGDGGDPERQGRMETAPTPVPAALQVVSRAAMVATVA